MDAQETIVLAVVAATRAAFIRIQTMQQPSRPAIEHIDHAAAQVKIDDLVASLTK